MVVMAAAVAAGPAVAQTIEEESGRIPGLPEPSIASSLPRWLADPAGIRSALGREGITFHVNYIADALDNPTGGVQQGGDYEGRLEVAIAADLEKLIGWPGLTFFTNGYQIHGHSISGEHLGVLMPVSFIEAIPDTRLYELWLEQRLFDDRLSIRLGQLAADSDFLISEGGQAFLNATWGWASIAGINLPDGGPAYPMAAPAVRVAVVPDHRFSFRTGLYTGDPAEDCAVDAPQICNPNGLAFPFSDPLLFMEGAYRYNQGADELAGAFKLGAWRLFSTFEQQSIGNNALPIGLPAIPGEVADQDWALYGILDQMLYRPPGSRDGRGVAMFARVVGAPSEGNMIEFYCDGGLTITGLSSARPNDIFGVGLAYTGVSSEISDFQRDTGEPVIADFEAVLELTYTAQIVPGFYVQPDFQYFWNPGGHVANPEDPTSAVPNAAVLGVRSTVNY